ncbi:MAG: hypothetical protein JW876_03160 [Candidatus Krumholzibacteriota bacterium]|mgnify:CR=1 FL=1|nr:hypothetical protein [Candidatus Krumholzibacteriota bacterium]
MKRVVHLITVLAILTVFLPSVSSASTIIDNRIERLTAFFSHHVVRVILHFNGHVEIVPIDDGGNDAMVGGDADDYANGRVVPDPDGPSADTKKDTKLGAGLIRPGGPGSHAGSMMR